MKKKVVDKRYIGYVDVQPLSAVLQHINQLILDFGEDAIFALEFSDYDSVDLVVRYMRDETDKEEAARLKREGKIVAYNEKTAKEREERELKQLAKLMKKYKDRVVV